MDAHDQNSFDEPQPPNQERWVRCPTGSLERFAALHRSRIRRRRLAMLGSLLVAGCLLIAAPVLVYQSEFLRDPTPQLPQYGGLSCGEVVERLDNFFASRLENEDRQRILQHLHDCPRCLQLYQRTAEDLQVELSWSRVPPPANADRPMLRHGSRARPGLLVSATRAAEHGFLIEDRSDAITLRGEKLEATVRKRGYVSGIMGGSLLDKQTGARDLGYGLDIVDWIMEPGSDEAYRQNLPGDLAYEFNNLYHGKTAKRSIEGPQICTQARELSPRVIEGRDFVAIEQSWQYTLAAPGRATGSEWKQKIVFPAGKRYFISSDEIHSRNTSESMFLRIDLPGHIKHDQGDSFSEIYLSYIGRIPSTAFHKNFAPDEKYNYRRERDGVPQRMIRAYHTRDPQTGEAGPWLAGMTLKPEDTSEAWCHQREYVCMIHEFGERPIQAGESFSAAFIVGWFDSIEEMEAVYDAHRGASRLEVDSEGWRLK